MTLDTRQYVLPIRAVLLRRMVVVIERDLAVLIRLAVFIERDFLRLCLALFILNDDGEADECEQDDQRDFHGRESYHKGMRKVGPEWQRLQSAKPRSPPNVRLPV